MASLNYVWENRAKFPLGSKSFLKAWAKRVLTLRELLKRNQNRNYLIRRGAEIANTAEIGSLNFQGNKSNLKIGAFSFIGSVEFALHDQITVGDFVCINDGAILLSASHDLSDPLWRHKKAPITIHNYAWIATNAIILPGVTVGEGAVVGAGAIVSRDVTPYSIVAGNPAKSIKRERVKDLKYNPCEFLAANQAWLQG